MNKLEIKDNVFESIKHVDENGVEYWSARELQHALEYKEWRKFEGVIKKVQEACKMSNNNVLDHFVQLDKMINLVKGAKRKVVDYKLSRYACYLIAQNGDIRIVFILCLQNSICYIS